MITPKSCSIRSIWTIPWTSFQWSIFPCKKEGLPRGFHPEVVPDADMILDSVIVEPLEPFTSDELTVSDKAFDAAPAEQPDEPLHDINSLLVIGVPPFWQQAEQDGERHVVVRYA